MTQLPHGFVVDGSGRLDPSAVQSNFDALSMATPPVLFGITKQSGSVDMALTWPGGDIRSDIQGAGHGFTNVRVIGHCQDQTDIGPVALAFDTVTTPGVFTVYAETTGGFLPPVGTVGLITVLYWEV